MKTHPFAPSSRHYEDRGGLDEEHILHIHQQIRKKLQETLWRLGTYWLQKLQHVSPRCSPRQGGHQEGSGQQSCAQIPMKKNKTTRQGNVKQKWIKQKYRKYPNKEKMTYNRRRVVGRELGDSKRDNACSFQHLLETLKYLRIGQLKSWDHT